jgi:hypothetical protein
LREAGHHHSFVEEFIDMRGIAIAAEAGRAKPAPAVRPDVMTMPDGQPDFSFPNQRAADPLVLDPLAFLKP